MDYKINEFAKMSGVSTRTLRYYDEIGLLLPKKVDDNEYRIYGAEQVDKLQQILFYKELGYPLNEIKLLLDSTDFDKCKSLENHLIALQNKKEQIEMMIKNVKKTICSEKEGTIMTDEEKFYGFKEELIKNNDEKYGEEVAKRYSKDVIDKTNEKFLNMSQASWNEQENTENDMFNCLKEAMANGSPECEKAMEAALLHQKWLKMFWTEKMYSKEAHLQLANGYLADERFKNYYDNKLGQGATKFLRDAIEIFTTK